MEEGLGNFRRAETIWGPKEGELIAAEGKVLPGEAANFAARRNRAGPESPAPLLLLTSFSAEQRENDLRLRVGDRQGLDAQLLLDLQALQSGAFLSQVRIDQIADTSPQCIDQLGHEVVLNRELLLARSQC